MTVHLPADLALHHTTMLSQLTMLTMLTVCMLTQETQENLLILHCLINSDLHMLEDVPV